MDKNTHWQTLIDLCTTAADNGEVPVAALLVKDNQIIAAAHNLVETHNNPTLHAEMLVLTQGYHLLGKYLTECDLYVSLEPCPMCAHAIKLSHIRRLYFGAYDPKGGGVEHGPRLLQDLTRLDISGGYHETAFASILKTFFLNRRACE